MAAKYVKLLMVLSQTSLVSGTNNTMALPIILRSQPFQSIEELSRIITMGINWTNRAARVVTRGANCSGTKVANSVARFG